jgi:hypothetical protein
VALITFLKFFGKFKALSNIENGVNNTFPAAFTSWFWLEQIVVAREKQESEVIGEKNQLNRNLFLFGQDQKKISNDRQTEMSEKVVSIKQKNNVKHKS